MNTKVSAVYWLSALSAAISCLISSTSHAQQNQKCLSVYLTGVLASYSYYIEPALIKRALSLTIQSSDLSAQAQAIPQVEKLEKKILLSWESRISGMIYARGVRLDFEQAKHHPLRRVAEAPNVFLELTDAERETYFQKFQGLRDAYEQTGLYLLPELRQKHAALVAELDRRVRQNPSEATNMLQGLFLGKLSLADEAIDAILGIHFHDVEKTVTPETYPGQEIWHGPNRGGFLTNYGYVRDVFQNVKLEKSDVVYDLGAGYGRVVLYGAHLFPETKFKGVELVTERAREIDQSAHSSKLNNLTVINKNVLDVDLSDGTVFYLFNPFPPIMPQVIEKLKAIGTRKKIRIVSYLARGFDQCPWLKRVGRTAGIDIYESVPQ